MLLTPAQLRDALQLPPETYRHWRRALPPLGTQRARRTCFTTGDLLALAITKALVDESGVRVGALGPVADRLFELCNQNGWTVMERAAVVIDLGTASAELSSEVNVHRLQTPIHVVPCRRLIEELRLRLLNEQPQDVQQLLAFPPTAVSSAR